MHDTECASAAGLPWGENQDGDYEAACVRCELHVTLSHADHAMILPLLTDFDKRSTGSLGRSFKRDVLVNGVPLRKGVRLEPTMSVPDTGFAFDSLGADAFPVVTTFWRRSRETLTRRRNPLFNEEYGLTFERSMTVDMLHAFFIGIMLSLTKFVVWFLLDAKLWGRTWHG